MSKGMSLPVEYMIIIIIAVVVLLAVITWFFLFWPHCPEIQLNAELTQACNIWFNNGCNSEGYPTLVIVNADKRIDSTSCTSSANEDGIVTIDEVCSFAGITTKENCYARCCS